MPRALLITQCLQQDFVGPVGAHEPLPNKLHVGREEAQRLLGADPAAGPVAQLMEWARAQPQDALEILHVRDWHDPADPAQGEHLAVFGRHCLAGSPGASLVLGLDAGAGPNEALVDSIALNDFEGSALGARIAKLSAEGPLRVGVVGVWTEAKVSFLLYDLKTRAKLDELATCSALTASASRAQHFNALEQLQRILGTRSFDSVGAFTDWLVPGSAAPSRPAPKPGFGPRLKVAGSAQPSAQDQELLGLLYRDSAEVELASLSGGFSGASVFSVRSRDALGQEQAPSVAKLGPRDLVAKERVAFERVESVLGNSAPSVRGFVDLGDRAGIKYSYAAMGRGAVRTLKKLFDSGAGPEQLVRILETVLGEILGPLYSAAQLEPLPLLSHYAFSPSHAASVRRNVTAIVGAEAARGERLSFPGGFEARNVCSFYEEFLPARGEEPLGESHFVSYVHGDLNGANVLLDARENVWVIDFAHTSRGHVLRDLAKLENDLLYLFTPLADEAELAQALRITAALREVRDLRAKLPEQLDGLVAPALLRAFAVLRVLRSHAAALCRDDRDPLQLSVALLRYSAHTLSFDEASPLQKRWALAASCSHAEGIVAATRANRRLRVDFLPELPGPGRLGLTICPGRRDRGRSLPEDLAELQELGTSRLVCLATAAELEWAGVPELRAGAEARGIRFVQLPIPDQGVPGRDEAAALSTEILAAIAAGETVVLHCLGGLGRSGTIAACALIQSGVPAQDALDAVRRARGPRAVESANQAAFVRSFRQRAPPVS